MSETIKPQEICSACQDGYTPLYCLNCADVLLRNEVKAITCERDGLKNALIVEKRAYNDAIGLLEAATNERDQLAAKCAEMRDLIGIMRVGIWDDALLKRIASVESDQCGNGWLSPEKKKVLVEALERMAGYAETVRLDRRKVVDGETMCLQMEDWCNGLLERVEEAKQALEAAR